MYPASPWVWLSRELGWVGNEFDSFFFSVRWVGLVHEVWNKWRIQDPNFWRGGGRKQCISPVVIYYWFGSVATATGLTEILRIRKRQLFEEEKIMSQLGGAIAPTVPPWLRHCLKWQTDMLNIHVAYIQWRRHPSSLCIQSTAEYLLPHTWVANIITSSVHSDW